MEPGSIIEYRWTEETENYERKYVETHRIDFQTEIPIQTFITGGEKTLNQPRSGKAAQ